MKNPIFKVLFVALIAFLMRIEGVDAEQPSAAHRPWIGLTCTVNKEQTRIECSRQYVEAVRRAGGVPVIVPLMADSELQDAYLQRLDGLVLIGGWDIPPAAYGEEPHPTTEEMAPVRWQWESRLIEEWLKTEKPILGICLGSQMTNVVRGGTLIQDIPSEVGKKVTHRGKELVWHRVKIKPGTRLHAILGADEVLVTSSHHQAAERIGEGLTVSARTDDGVVEATEIPGATWRVFLQWHPERMDETHILKVFGALVEAAGKPDSAHGTSK